MPYTLLPEEKTKASKYTLLPEEESTGNYLKRNLAKAPALAYETARSGLGFGNLAELGARKAEQYGVPGARYLKSAQRTLLPSTQQAQEEYKRFLGGGEKLAELAQRFGLSVDDPQFLQMLASGELSTGLNLSPEQQQYLTESKAGDFPIEFALTELPFLLAAGIPKSVGALGNYALRAGGALGGSKLGRSLGGSAGEMLGDKEIGEALGGLLGAYGGSAAAHKFINRPSKIYAKKVYELEKQNAKNEFNDMVSRPKKIMDEINAYDKTTENMRLKQQQKYKEVEQSRHKEKVKADGVARVAREINEAAHLGHSKANEQAAKKVANDVLKALKGEAPKSKPSGLVDEFGKPIPVKEVQGMPKLDLKTAEELQRNINGQIYAFPTKGERNNFKQTIHPIIKALDEFIAAAGSEEHHRSLLEAKKITTDIAQREKNRKEWRAAKTKELNEAKSAAKKANTMYERKKKELSMSPQAYLKRLASKHSGETASGKFSGDLTTLLSSLGLGAKFGSGVGALAGLGVKGYNKLLEQARINKFVSDVYPDIFSQTNQQLRSQFIKDLPRVALRGNR